MTLDVAALREKAEGRACGPCLGEGVIVRSPRKPDTCTSCNGTGKRPDTTTIALLDHIDDLRATISALFNQVDEQRAEIDRLIVLSGRV